MTSELTNFVPEKLFELNQRQAVAVSKSSLIPKDYQHNVANCLLAVEMANRLAIPPIMVMQNMYVVHGKPGWSSQFLIAAFNQSGKFSSITYEFFGQIGTDGYGCRAKTVDLRTGEQLTGPPVSIDTAKKEGWFAKSGSKWQSMPELMLRYRAATFLVRTTAPEITMGLPMADEVDDITDRPKSIDVSTLLREVTPAQEVVVSGSHDVPSSRE